MKPETDQNALLLRAGESELAKISEPLFIEIITETGQDMHIAIRDIGYIIRHANGRINLCQCSDGGEYAWNIVGPCAEKVWQWASENSIDLR